jgi:hypothetical protein
MNALGYPVILQPTLRSALSVDIPADSRGSTLPVDITIDYPLCCLLRYCNRLCCVLSLALQPTISCALLRLAILQPTVFCTLPADITTDYPPLYPTFRNYN